MQDELDDYPEDYCSLNYEYRCNLLSTIEFKYERKRVSAQINKIDSARAASIYDINEYVRIPRKKKARTGVLHSNKSPKEEHKYHGIHRCCVL